MGEQSVGIKVLTYITLYNTGCVPPMVMITKAELLQICYIFDKVNKICKNMKDIRVRIKCFKLHHSRGTCRSEKNIRHIYYDIIHGGTVGRMFLVLCRMFFNPL